MSIYNHNQCIDTHSNTLKDLCDSITPTTLGTVVVVMGGLSRERDISFLSGNGVLNALKSLGVNAISFDPAQQTFEDLTRLNPDRVMLCLHGLYGEDGCIQGALELLKIPYTGSGVLGSSIALNKVMTKRLWLADGISTLPYEYVTSEAELITAFNRLSGVFKEGIALKPVCEGSSLGFSHITDVSQISSAWTLASEYSTQCIVEPFIKGREFTAAILKIKGQTIALPLVEIKAPQGNYDYQNKYFSDDTQYEAPALLSQTTTELIQRLAERAFDSVGCDGWGRIDLMLHCDPITLQETPYLLEINTTPGMTGHSLVPMAANALGIAYPQLCALIASTAQLKI